MLKLSHLETHPRILTNIRNFKFRAHFSQAIHWPPLNTCPAHWLELQKWCTWMVPLLAFWMFEDLCRESFARVSGHCPFREKNVFFPIWSVWTLRYYSHSLMGKSRKNWKHTHTWMSQVVKKIVPVHLKEPTERQTCYISARSYKQICMHKVSPKEIRFQDHSQCFGVMQLWYYVERFACKGAGSM